MNREQVEDKDEKIYFHKTNRDKFKLLENNESRQEILCCSSLNSDFLFWGDLLVVFKTDTQPFESSCIDIGRHMTRSPWDEHRFYVKDFEQWKIIGIYSKEHEDNPYDEYFCNFGYERTLC